MSAGPAAFAGLLMLFYAWYTGGWVYAADASQFFVFTLHLFDWMLLIGGIAMIVVAVVCYLGARIGLLLEAIVSGLCGLIMITCAGTWAINGSMGLNTMLIGFFSLTFLSGAGSAWRMYAGTSSKGGRSAVRVSTPVAPAAPPTPHPASRASSVLPKDGEPPPEEGYLAALSREKD